MKWPALPTGADKPSWAGLFGAVSVLYVFVDPYQRNAPWVEWMWTGVAFAIFLALFIILNLMLHFVVVRPLSRMARAADAISTGNLTLLDLPATGKDQVAVLARAFNRMRRSLEKAMKMMEE